MDKPDPAIDRERKLAELTDFAAREAFWGSVMAGVQDLVLSLPAADRIPRVSRLQDLVRQSRDGLRAVTFPSVPAEWSMTIAGEIEERFDDFSDEYLERLERLKNWLSRETP
jgi:hypothetical protein